MEVDNDSTIDFCSEIPIEKEKQKGERTKLYLFFEKVDSLDTKEQQRTAYLSTSLWNWQCRSSSNLIGSLVNIVDTK